MTPEPSKCSATRNDPYAATVVSVVSSIGSSMRLMTSEMARPTPRPTATPVPTMRKKSTVAPAKETCPEVMASSTMPNSTMPVPSLSRLSPSTSRRRRCGAPTALNTEITAMGSVADTRAAKRKARPQGKPLPTPSRPTMAAAVATVATTTPGKAREETASLLRKRSRASMAKAASKMSPGRNTANSSSLVRCGGVRTPFPPRTTPARTSATV